MKEIFVDVKLIRKRESKLNRLQKAVERFLVLTLLTSKNDSEVHETFCFMDFYFLGADRV
jgi:hypothetical protein